MIITTNFDREFVASEGTSKFFTCNVQSGTNDDEGTLKNLIWSWNNQPILSYDFHSLKNKFHSIQDSSITVNVSIKFSFLSNIFYISKHHSCQYFLIAKHHFFQIFHSFQQLFIVEYFILFNNTTFYFLNPLFSFVLDFNVCSNHNQFFMNFVLI